MGAPPPTRMAPMDTCTDERRLMLMGTCGANSTVARLGRHSLKAAIIRTPESVCPERVRRKPERRRRKFRPETLRHRNGRRRKVQPPRASGERWSRIVSTHRRGAALTERLISQVTGQKGGRRLRRRCACRLFCLAESPLRRFQPNKKRSEEHTSELQ